LPAEKRRGSRGPCQLDVDWTYPLVGGSVEFTPQPGELGCIHKLEAHQPTGIRVGWCPRRVDDGSETESSSSHIVGRLKMMHSGVACLWDIIKLPDLYLQETRSHSLALGNIALLSSVQRTGGGGDFAGGHRLNVRGFDPLSIRRGFIGIVK
jgi:hypothetical protein